MVPASQSTRVQATGHEHSISDQHNAPSHEDPVFLDRVVELVVQRFDGGMADLENSRGGNLLPPYPEGGRPI
jgi:hypothetical protein